MGSRTSVPGSGADKPTAVTRSSRLQLPGLNLPLNWVPLDNAVEQVIDKKRMNVSEQGEAHELFPSALDQNSAGDGSIARRLTPIREITMLQIMDILTDKPSWREKVFDDRVAQRWKAEAMGTDGRNVSQAMADWIIDELRYKASIANASAPIMVYDSGVVKSDCAVSETAKDALKTAARQLENIPLKARDWHPGSDGKVLDLVHPSLFPLIYGRSRVLTDHLVGLEDCVESCGRGMPIRVPPIDEARANPPVSYGYSMADENPYSTRFQWLPCEVELEDTGKAKITSYINNLHPRRHQELYSIIEDMLETAIPLWDMTLTSVKDPFPFYERISYREVKHSTHPNDLPEDQHPQKGDNEDEEDFWERLDEWEGSIRVVAQPEPGTFNPPSELRVEDTINIKKDYRSLQVIVKLANIELTPEKPSYDGGTWHVEGQLNEHICATALYYYDCENITNSRLAFRQQSSTDDANQINYPQGEHDFLQTVFGVEPDGAAVQEIGSVACIEGRLIAFPNILQHRVEPFRLADATKPGHRKILALFLVDPGIKIISTANVPPQQKDWWAEVVSRDFEKSESKLRKLSTELKLQIFQGVDDFPIGMDEAKEIRLKLMEERRRYVVVQRSSFESAEFSLCEH